MDAVFSINPQFDNSLTLETDGWEKLTILYSNEWVSNVSYLCWKVNNTEQVFRIPTKIVYENHGLNYSEHFSLVLKTFREDYLSWEKENFPEDWMKRYQKMFHLLIKK